MIDISRSVWFQYLVLFFGILCIGWSAVFVKLADVSGFTSAFYRMGIAAVAIIPLWIKRKRPINDFRSLKVAIICGVFFACDIAMWNTSIMLSKATISTLLANLAPVWVGLGAIFILKEKPQKIYWAGTLLALIGVLIVIGFNNVYHLNPGLGNMLALGASCFYASYLLTTQKGRSTLDTVTFTAVSMIISTVLLFILCVSTSTPLTGFSTKSWLSLLGVGLISQLGGWLAINFALGYIKSTTASVSLLSQSVFTALFSVPVLGELLSFREVIGGIIVLLGIYLVSRYTYRKPKDIEPEYE